MISLLFLLMLFVTFRFHKFMQTKGSLQSTHRKFISSHIPLSPSSESFDQIIKTNENIVHDGYRQIIQKEFSFPNERKHSYEILTQKHQSVVVFVWNTQTNSSTLIREFHPGPEKALYGTVAGMYESKKHTSPLQAAKFELEEEAYLASENWFPLLDSPSTRSISLDKYSTNQFYPYLALDCYNISNPKPRDSDEFIQIIPNVSYESLMKIISRGDMNMISTFAVMMGLQKLRQLNIHFDL